MYSVSTRLTALRVPIETCLKAPRYQRKLVRFPDIATEDANEIIFGNLPPRKSPTNPTLAVKLLRMTRTGPVPVKDRVAVMIFWKIVERVSNPMNDKVAASGLLVCLVFVPLKERKAVREVDVLLFTVPVNEAVPVNVVTIFLIIVPTNPRLPVKWN